MKFLIFATILGTFVSANAALPPYFSSLNMINTAAEGVGAKAGGEYISKITLKDETVTIVTQNCSYDVQLQLVPPPDGLVGPANYAVKNIDSKCKN